MSIDWDYLESKKNTKDLILAACGLCDCGTQRPSIMLISVLQNAAKAAEDETRNSNYDSCCSELAAKVLDSYGWVEHGTGVGATWITDDGKRLLDLIESLILKEEP